MAGKNNDWNFEEYGVKISTGEAFTVTPSIWRQLILVDEPTGFSFRKEVSLVEEGFRVPLELPI